MKALKTAWRKSFRSSGESSFVDGRLLVPKVASHRCYRADIGWITSVRNEVSHRRDNSVTAEEHSVEKLQTNLCVKIIEALQIGSNEGQMRYARLRFELAKHEDQNAQI